MSALSLPPASRSTRKPAGTTRSAAWACRSAVSLNMLDMIGVGPFITLPLVVAAMHGPQAHARLDRSARVSRCATAW